jgi:superfamily II DNA or RNA helicase
MWKKTKKNGNSIRNSIHEDADVYNLGVRNIYVPKTENTLQGLFRLPNFKFPDIKIYDTPYYDESFEEFNKDVLRDNFCKEMISVPHENPTDRIINCDNIPLFTPEYCKKLYADDHITENTSTTIMSYTWPNLQDKTFNKNLTDYFSGVKGSCNLKITKPDVSKSRCVFPKKIHLNNFTQQQRFVSFYLSPKTPYRGLLAWHSLGSGKTLTCIALMAQYLQNDPNRVIVVLVKPSLKQNFMDEINKVDSLTLFGKVLSNKEIQKRINRQIDLVSYEELANRLKGRTVWDRTVQEPGIKKEGYGALPFKTKARDEDIRPLLNNTLVIIDEAHNLITPEDAKYPSVEDANVVVEAVKRAVNIRILLLTATPLRKEVFELGLLLNMLKSRHEEKFPEITKQKRVGERVIEVVDKKNTQKAFDSLFFDMQNDQFLPKNQDIFIRLSKGIVSYFNNELDYSQFPQKIVHENIDVVMSKEQTKKYLTKRKAEILAQKKKNSIITCKNQEDAKYCIASRSSSNTSLHFMKDIQKYIASDDLAEIAPKLEVIVDNIIEHSHIGKQFVYSFFDTAGVNIIARALEKKGWVNMDVREMKKTIKNFSPNRIRERDWPLNGLEDEFYRPLEKKMSFTVLGSEDNDVEYKKKLTLEFFNMKSNFKGEYINVLIANKNYSEGITLKDVRTVHVSEPPTSTSLLSQVIGRAARFCSHKNLTFPGEWNVTVYNYFSVLPDDGNSEFCSEFKSLEDCDSKEYCEWQNDATCKDLSVDYSLQKMAKKQSMLSEYFESLLKSNAVDCKLFEGMNGTGQFSCFNEKGCETLSRNECSSRPDCSWKNNILYSGSCIDDKSEAQKCKQMYTTENECSSDVGCKWENNSCIQKYTSSKQYNSIAVLVDNTYHVFKLIPTPTKTFKEKLDVVLDMLINRETLLESTLFYIIDLLKSKESLTEDLLNQLRYNIRKNQQTLSDLWDQKDIRDLSNNIIKIYNSPKLIQNTYVANLNCFSCKTLLFSGKTIIHYVVYCKFFDEEYLINSELIPDASINVEQIEALKIVFKCLDYKDIRVYLFWDFDQGRLTNIRFLYFKTNSFGNKVITKVLESTL